MQMKHSKKITSFILCMVLIVAMALGIAGCNGNTGNSTASDTGTEVNLQSNSNESEANAHIGGNIHEAEDDAQADENTHEVETNAQANIIILGTGSTAFNLTVADQEGGETQFEVHTDKETVGEALLELEFIDGEKSEYGLYVKTVNGITVDYDKDGAYWAFYINGEYASSGVDSTKITEGENYSFKVE